MVENKKNNAHKWRPFLPWLFLAFLFQDFFHLARSQPFIGVNYGQVADNLPPPVATASLLQSTTISKLRLYGADPAVIRAFAGTKISLVLGVANGDIPSLAGDPVAAANWVAGNISPFVPATPIFAISVGNEVLSSGDAAMSSQLLPAMKNLNNALAAAGTNISRIKVSTVHYMSVLGQSDPPSSGKFHDDLLPTMVGILGFLRDTSSPFMINPYPWFAYQSDPRPETLAFCLFQPNSGRVDSGTGITYTNMFDAQVDAIRFALDSAGFPDLEITVAETGWPYRGDAGEPGASVANAKAFNGNLVTHLRSMVGTPKMPGKSVETYIFALYDEDLKPGPTSERSFGLYQPNLTMTYDIGLSATSFSTIVAGKAPHYAPAAAPRSTQIEVPPATPGKPKSQCPTTVSSQLHSNVDPECSRPRTVCDPNQPGTDCFLGGTSSCEYLCHDFLLRLVISLALLLDKL